jgi:hypothetical protein
VLNYYYDSDNPVFISLTLIRSAASRPRVAFPWCSSLSITGTAGRCFIMHRGYIKLYRKLLEWEWFLKSETLQLFLYLLLRANWKDSRFMGYEIKRGEMVIGTRALSKDLKISRQKIRNSLERLKSTHEITLKSTHLFSIVTICNYEKYQVDENEINPPINPPIQPVSNPPSTH